MLPPPHPTTYTPLGAFPAVPHRLCPRSRVILRVLSPLIDFHTLEAQERYKLVSARLLVSSFSSLPLVSSSNLANPRLPSFLPVISTSFLAFSNPLSLFQQTRITLVLHLQYSTWLPPRSFSAAFSLPARLPPSPPVWPRPLLPAMSPPALTCTTATTTAVRLSLLFFCFFLFFLS